MARPAAAAVLCNRAAARCCGRQRGPAHGCGQDGHPNFHTAGQTHGTLLVRGLEQLADRQAVAAAQQLFKPQPAPTHPLHIWLAQRAVVNEHSVLPSWPLGQQHGRPALGIAPLASIGGWRDRAPVGWTPAYHLLLARMQAAEGSRSQTCNKADVPAVQSLHCKLQLLKHNFSAMHPPAARCWPAGCPCAPAGTRYQQW